MKKNNFSGLKVSVVLCLVSVLVACHTNTRMQDNDKQVQSAHNNLNSTLWLQNSAEFKASALQTYNTAKNHLAASLADTGVSAALEQTSGFAGLPPAIILDVDETVLDNSPYQAQLIKNGKPFELQTWDSWVALRSAKAIPGAVELINEALRKGIRVIFLTNRECMQRTAAGGACPQKMDTLVNLRSVGINNVNIDDLMLKNEHVSWTSEKQSRRMTVAQKYRILMLFGDDLGDFLPHVKKDINHQQRAELVDKHKQRWGQTWYVFGNPTYGSWQRVLMGELKDHLDGYE